MRDVEFLEALRKVYEQWAGFKQWISQLFDSAVSEYGWIAELIIVGCVGFWALAIGGLFLYLKYDALVNQQQPKAPPKPPETLYSVRYSLENSIKSLVWDISRLESQLDSIQCKQDELSGELRNIQFSITQVQSDINELDSKMEALTEKADNISYKVNLIDKS